MAKAAPKSVSIVPGRRCIYMHRRFGGETLLPEGDGHAGGCTPSGQERWTCRMVCFVGSRAVTHGRFGGYPRTWQYRQVDECIERVTLVIPLDNLCMIGQNCVLRWGVCWSYMLSSVL